MESNRSILLCVGIVVTILGSLPAIAATLRVPAEYASIQLAIESALDNDTILVSDGVYSGGMNKNLVFHNKSLLLASENGPDNCVIDCQHNGRGIYRNNEPGSVTIRGLTIQNGNADTSDGGGVYSVESRTDLINCRISGCSAANGAGACIVNFDNEIQIQIQECVFEDNTASNAGGGLFVNGGFLTLTGCSVIGNHTNPDALYGQRYGGAYVSSSYIDSCVFSSNEGFGLSIYRPGFGSTVTRCHFIGNQQDIAIDDKLHTGGPGGGYWTFYGPITIGGSSGYGNTFHGSKQQAINTIIHASQDTDPAIQVTYNIFSDYENSPYLTNSTRFNLAYSQYDGVPIIQDVYVSPFGDDSNPGISPDLPFRTINHACHRIKATDSLPLTVHLAPGQYAVSSLDEWTDGLILDNVSIVGAGADQTVLDGEYLNTTFSAQCRNAVISGIKFIRSSSSGVYCTGNSARVQDCVISDNRQGGIGMNLSDVSVVRRCIIEDNGSDNPDFVMAGLTTISSGNQPYMQFVENCIIRNNSGPTVGGLFVGGWAEIWNCTISGNVSASAGGGIRGQSTEVRVLNCILEGNHAPEGGAVYVEGFDSSAELVNCTFVNNSADTGASVGVVRNSSIENCIMRDNFSPSGVQIQVEVDNGYAPEQMTRITSSDIENGLASVYVEPEAVASFIWDSSNFDEDPLFVAGPEGNFYLSHTAAGQAQDSPCVDRGQWPASDYCTSGSPRICLNSMSTRTDEIADSDMVDVGYHYSTAEPPAPGTWMDLRFLMPATYFASGDVFRLDLSAESQLNSALDAHLFIVLEISGQLWFYPSWTLCEGPEYQFDYRTIQIRKETLSIISQFQWPEISYSLDDIRFMALCTNWEMSEVTSNLAEIVWGFGN